MDSIIHRTAEDDFQALMTACGLQSSPHCEVISIAPSDGGTFRIWAKYDSSLTDCNELDKLIDDRIESQCP